MLSITAMPPPTEVAYPFSVDCVMVPLLGLRFISEVTMGLPTRVCSEVMKPPLTPSAEAPTVTNASASANVVPKR